MKEYKKSIRKAAALSYQPDKNNAPVIVASGCGYVAEKILQKAGELDLPVVRNDGTAAALALLEPGIEIPPELFQAVAEIYSFILNTAQKD